MPRLLDRDARLPALLAAVLAVAAVVQLLDTGEVELPPAGALGGGGQRVVEQPGMPVTPASAMRRSIFAPSAVAAGAGAAAPSDPLGGTRIAGSVTIGRRSYAIVLAPGQPPRRVPVGGTVAGWRVSALTATGAVLRRGAERLELPFGAQGPAVAESPPEEEEQQP